jgi:hypothetical protein
MEKLIFDSGIREFQINNNGVLRFNPADPNVYARLVESRDMIKEVEDKLLAKAKELIPEGEEEANGETVIRLMSESDKEIKRILSYIFGAENDFDEIFAGVNLMAVGENGERVITNFFYAVEPIIKKGAEKCAEQQIDSAVKKAQGNRAQRRAAAKK